MNMHTCFFFSVVDVLTFVVLTSPGRDNRNGERQLDVTFRTSVQKLIFPQEYQWRVGLTF